VRVAIVSNGDFFSTRMVAPLFADPDVEVTGAILVRVPPGSRARRRALGLGRGSGLRYSLHRAAAAAGPRAEGLLSQTPIFLHHLCDRHGVPYLVTRHANAADTVAALGAWTPEVLVSVSAPERLVPELLQTAPMASINLHLGLLPRYAGVAPYFWVLRNGETEAGLTVHMMVAEVDAGPILRQRRLTIEPDDTSLGLHLRLTQAGAEELTGALKELPGSIATATPQNLADLSFSPWPAREDLRELRRRGRSLARLADYRRMGDLLEEERERQREADRRTGGER
jgi:folate-dependent phosphoribosylglycinamide formyltransferase PurN